MNNLLKFLILIILLITLIFACTRLFSLQPYGSYLWYSGPVALHLKDDVCDKTLISMIDNNGNIKVLEHNNKTSKNKIHNIRADYEKNEHAHPALLVLPDKRIMIIYSKHNMKNEFNYKITAKPWDLSELSSEKNIMISGNSEIKITYPAPFVFDNSIYIFFRGLNWHPTVFKFTLPDEEGNIEFVDIPKQIVQSTAKRPYVKYLLNGNKVYMAYTTGHAHSEYPNWIYFSIFDLDDYNLYDIKGNYLADINNMPFEISKNMPDSPLIVDNTNNSRNVIWDIALDNKENPIIAYVRISENEQKHIYYLAKWDGEKWIQQKLADGGKYFHNIKGVEETFSAGLSIDKNSPDIIWASLPRKGLFGTKYEIAKISVDENLNVTDTKFYTKNSYYNNIRPLSIKDDDKIVFLFGKYYYYANNKKYSGYPLKLNYIKK